MDKRLFTSESVTEGHPDKMCDAISDAILDALMAKDPMSRVACETASCTGFVLVTGEITTNAYVDIPKIVRDTVKEIGYDKSEYGFDGNTCAVMVSIEDVYKRQEAGLAQIDEAQRKNMETAEQVEHIEHAILEHMELMKQLLKQSDDFTHKENVKVYRNVQAVVVDEVKKQTEAMSSQNEELVRRNENLQKQSRGLKPLMIVTLAAAVINIALLAAQIAGVF